MSTLQTINVKHPSSGSNNVVLDSSGNTTVSGALTVSGNATITGTLQAGGVSGAIYPLTLMTAQASTSGTFIDFTGIPSWVRRITLMFQGVSTNGSSNLQVQLGTSSGIDALNYLGAESTAVGGTNIQNSTGFVVKSNGNPANVLHGIVVLSLLNSSTNLWVESGTLATSNTTQVGVSGGSKSLASVLTQVRVTTIGGTDTFDAGSINALYE